MFLLNASFAFYVACPNSQKQADLFYIIVFKVINKHAPLRLVTFRHSDKPWIIEYFKQSISRRAEAYQTCRTVY